MKDIKNKQFFPEKEFGKCLFKAAYKKLVPEQ